MKKYMLLALLATLSGCADPKDTLIPKDILALDEKSAFVQTIKKLDPEDKKLLGQYLMQSTVTSQLSGNQQPFGITVKEAIEEQKRTNQRKQAEEAKGEEIRQAALTAENEKINAIQATLKIYFVKLTEVKKHNYSDTFGMVLSIENTSGKILSGFKANVEFKDQFNQPIKTLAIEENHDWGIGEKGTFTYGFNYNKFNDDTVKLLTIPQDKLKHQATITDVIFK